MGCDGMEWDGMECDGIGVGRPGVYVICCTISIVRYEIRMTVYASSGSVDNGRDGK